MKRCLALFVASCVLALVAGTARAQSTPTTCAPGNGDELWVQVNGRTTTVESTASGILVNGAFCGWQDEISTLYVFGGALNDRVTFRGRFIPGIDPEPDFDELEVSVSLGAGTDTVTLELFENDDWIEFTSGSAINLNVDGFDSDADIGFSNVEVLKIMALGGDDIVRADGSTIPSLYLYGGDGNDQLVGSINSSDIIDGGAGNDEMSGFDGDDLFTGGPGIDTYLGGAGNDTVDYRDKTAAVTVTIGNGLADDGTAGELEEVPADVESVLGGKGADVLIGNSGNNTLDGGGGADLLDGGPGADVLIGGPGVDTVDYSGRDLALTVTIGDGLSNDGGPEDMGGGAMDNVDGTVENVTGGFANDTLIGNSAKNTLRGGPGNDNLQGGAGNDTLYGDAGDDSLLGEAGADKLYGALGSDILDGGADADVYSAGGDNDFVYNDDGVAETVNCGGGNADDAEVDTGAVDTFIGCEL